MLSRWMKSAFVVLALFSLSALGDEFTTNSISNKTGQSPNWHLGDTITVTWTTSWQHVGVGYWNIDDDNDNGTVFWRGDGSTGKTQWTVNVNGSQWNNQQGFFRLYVENEDDDPKNNYFSSGIVNVLPASVPSATASMTATAATGKATGSSTEAAGSSSSNKLGSGTIAGISVGAAAGVLALIAAIFFLLRNRKLKNRLQNAEATAHRPFMPYDQVPPSAAVAAGGHSPDPSKGFGMTGATAAGAATGAAVGGAAGYYSNEKNHPGFAEQNQEGIVAAELPTRSRTIRASELPAEPVNIRFSSMTGFTDRPTSGVVSHAGVSPLPSPRFDAIQENAAVPMRSPPMLSPHQGSIAQGQQFSPPHHDATHEDSAPNSPRQGSIGDEGAFDSRPLMEDHPRDRT